MAERPTWNSTAQAIATARQPYARTGECVRCGACCAHEDPPCEHFTPATETEPAACAIWDDPKRDRTCREWPVGPPVKLETCGYRFIHLDSMKVLGRHKVE